MKTRALIICTAALGVLCALNSASLAAGGSPNAAERQALDALKGKLTGLIAWESNRTGAWELYAMNADGTGARRLTNLAQTNPTAYASYMRPRVSPDGSTILFAYGKHGSAAECWLVPVRGGAPGKLCAGLPLNWSADGARVYLLRDSIVMSHDLATGKEAAVSATKAPTDGKSGGTVGTLHPSGGSVIMRTPKANEYFVFNQGKTLKTMGGCESRFSADGRYAYWVQGPKDFRVWDMYRDTEHQLLGTPPVEPFNYTYFPTVSDDAHWLMYGASPGQHSHDTSDYEVYLQELLDWKAKGLPVRLSFNTATDRWPYLWVAPKGSGNPLPEGPYDVASNRATNPAPPPLTLFSFADQDAKPEFGGDWGLWPQQAGCQGTATFMPGQDAEGRKGGSMKIDYTIQSEPKSFSLWLTSGKTDVDLSSYDRFVIYAKGTVPSFTLVVKDRTATDPDAPVGIADFVVTGLTNEWGRFEAPFDQFTPRKAGARMDWSAINHMGIAAIAPQNASAGTFWVDNLRAEPRP